LSVDFESLSAAEFVSVDRVLFTIWRSVQRCHTHSYRHHAFGNWVKTTARITEKMNKYVDTFCAITYMAVRLVTSPLHCT